MRRKTVTAIGAAALMLTATATPCQGVEDDPAPRVLWVTDLYEPVNDPDDHYDLAVGMASEAPPTMIVLDDHLDRQTGQAPAVADLADIIEEPEPRVVLDSQTWRQAQMLRNSPNGSVQIVSLGALTAIGELIERRPRLVRRKVDHVTVFAGDTAEGAPVEYNVAQDPEAFLTVMTSNLHVRWVPCFDGGLWQAGTSSYTVTTDSELLTDASSDMRDWFDRYIGDRYGVRNLWATGILTGDEPAGAKWDWGFIRFNDDGVVDRTGRHLAYVQELVVNDREAFEGWMVDSTREAIDSLD